MDISDLLKSMLLTEAEYVSPETYNPNANFLFNRRYIVDWISDIGDRFQLHPKTTHVAVLYFDFIMRETFPVLTPPTEDRSQLIATACISVAAKYEEAEEHCPPIPELLDSTELGYQHQGITPLGFRSAELEVLKYLFWTLRCHPPLAFVNFHMENSGSCLYADDTWRGEAIVDKLPMYMRKYTDFFCNLCLQEYGFSKFLPSLLAAGIIGAARVTIQVSPMWRPELEALTGYKEADVIPVYEAVIKYYNDEFPGHGGGGGGTIVDHVSPKSVADDWA